MTGSLIGALRVTLGLDSAQFQDGLRKSNASLDSWGKGALATASKIGAALGAAFSAGAVIQASDRYVEMTNSLRVLGMTSEQAAAKLSEIGAIAQRTRTPLEATAQLYQRVSIASRELGATQDQVLRFTENIGLALAQQGGSAEQAAGALQQLGQALAGGVVRAEEFNSILEGAYPIAQAAANGIEAAGGSVGKLRQLMLDGEVTSKAFFDAILSQTTQLSAAFAGTVPTVGQAMQVLRDQWTLAVGQITGSTSAISTAILKVADGVAVTARIIADNMNQIIGLATAAAAAYGGVLAASLAGPLIASARAAVAQMIALEMALGATSKTAAIASVAVKGLSTAFGLLKRALVATGIGAIVVLAGTLIGKLLDLRQATGSWGETLKTLGDLAKLVWQGIVDSAAAIPAGLSYVWATVQAGFYKMIAGLQQKWFSFVSILQGWMPDSDLITDVYSRAAAALGETEADLEAAQNRSAEAGAKAAKIIGDAFAPVAEKMAELRKKTDESTAATTAFGNAAGGPGGAGDKAAKGAGKAAKAQKDLLAELHKELDARQALIGLYGDERQRAEALQQVQQKLGDEIGRYSQTAIQGAADRIVAIEDEEEAWESATQRMESLTDGLASAWGDWLSGGLRDFKGFVSNILGSFKSMISDMIATAAANPIRIAITGAMGGMPGAAAAGVPGVGGTGGLLSGLGASIGGIFNNVIAGAVSGFTGLLSGGLTGAFKAVSTQAALAGGAFGGLATTLGAIAAPVAAVAALFSFFSSKTKELDRGLRVTVAGMDTLVEAYRRTEKSRFWGLSKKRRTRYEEADDAVADPIEDYVAKMQEAVLKAAESLGVGTSAFEDFAYQVKVSTKGMSDEEAVQHIQEEMGKLGDAFAGLVPDLAQFTQEGEGAMATLDRLATSFSVVNGALGDLGLALYEASVSGAGAAASFAELFGSLDAFQQASGAYYQAFYTEQERLTRLRQVSQQAIRDAGLSVPATREAYRQLVEAQDLSTEAGREAAAVLLQLAPAFDQIYGAAEQAAGSAANLTQALAEAAQTQAQLLRDTLTPTQQAAADQARMAAVYERLGVAVPQTIAAYRALIQGLDLTTESGRATLAALASVSDALLDTFDAAEQAAQAARDAWVDASADLAKMLRDSLTPDQQVIADQERMARVFRDLGYTVPQSVTAYRDLIRGLDLTTEAGRAALAAINGVSGVLLDTFEAARQAAEDARKAAEEAAKAARQAWVDASTERARLLRETLTPDQQAAADQSKLQRVFDRMGLAVPQTMAAYREILTSLDLTTESGRAALEAITSVSDTLLDSLNALGEAQKARQDLLVSLMTDQQRAAYEQEQITAVFRDLGAQVPRTLAGLQAFIAGLDLTGEAGRAALEKITGISDALKNAFGEASRQQGNPGERMGSEAANSIAEERERLERQLLELQGNTLELRRRELAAINPANRALQEMIWRLEDAKAAMDNLSTNSFATLVDYELARAKAANSTMAPGATPAAEKKAQEARQARDSAVLVEMRDYLHAVVNNTHRAARETRDLRIIQEGQTA